MTSDDEIARATTPLFPYTDGSGFEMAVRVTIDDAFHDPTIVAITISQHGDRIHFDAGRWTTVRDEIDRLLRDYAQRDDLTISTIAKAQEIK